MEAQYAVVGVVLIVAVLALLRAGDAVSQTTLRDTTGRPIDPSLLESDATDDVREMRPRRTTRLPAKLLRVTSWFPWLRS